MEGVGWGWGGVVDFVPPVTKIDLEAMNAILMR